MGIAPDVLIELYRVIYTIRRFEETVSEIFSRGRLPGFTHSYLGMEAVAAGFGWPLRSTDMMASTHRGHGHAIAKGLDPSKLMAELYGRATGICAGKGGSMHFADFSLGFLGGNGIVAGGMPMAVGAALGRKLDGTDDVVVAFTGEGGVNQGVFHESVNLAAIWRVPLIVVVENNQYTQYGPYGALTAGGNIAARARGYGLPEVEVDGQDVAAVYEVAGEAIRRARSGEGPSLIDVDTYRFRGHHEGEEAILGVNVYRPVEEIEEQRASRDPVELAREQAAAVGVTGGTLQAVEREVDSEVARAVEFAEASPDPEPQDALTHILAEA
ncbi:MAG: thiamine pyrophosphate-dependent dehydrogenase E1 component subunit alpha [Actinomycetia bacterium]|nr:thiamine pyrophosphate-dependent dehydrogenase E1 component subunit alpha [Actinomycetes bacterium]